jgi:hypothetical protein
MTWYNLIKTSAPYSENICPVCTSGLLVDFWHEKGPKFADSPFYVGICPQCGAAIKFEPSYSESTPGFQMSNACEISRADLAKALKHGIPNILVVKDDEAATGAITPRAAVSKGKWWK